MQSLARHSLFQSAADPAVRPTWSCVSRRWFHACTVHLLLDCLLGQNFLQRTSEGAVDVVVPAGLGRPVGRGQVHCSDDVIFHLFVRPPQVVESLLPRLAVRHGVQRRFCRRSICSHPGVLANVTFRGGKVVVPGGPSSSGGYLHCRRACPSRQRGLRVAKKEDSRELV